MINKKVWMGIIVLFLVIIANSIYCLNCLDEKYWGKYFCVGFGDLLNILVLGIVIYVFVEYKNDSRSKKVFLEHVAYRIIAHLEDERMYRISKNQDVNYIRVKQKLIFNELDILKHCSGEFDFENDIIYCKTMFKEYWDIVSDNIGSLHKLKDKEIDLHNKLVNLIGKIENITLNLYK